MTNPLTSSLFPDSHPELLSSYLSSAAIGEQLDTGDETGIIGCQEERGPCNFVRLSHATHRNSGHDPRDRIRGLPARQGRLDGARTQDVCTDTALLQVGRPGTRKRAQGRFGRAVDAETGSTLHARDRTDQNDGTALNQERQGLLHGEKGSLDVQVSHIGDIPLDASDVVSDRLHRLIELSLAASGSSFQLAHATSRPIDRSVRLAPSYSPCLPCAGGPGQGT